MTTNYRAREYGVRSGMPSFVAKKLCPNMTSKKPDFVKYEKVGKMFKEILYEIDPFLESQGLDEANLDVTDYMERNGLKDEEGRLFLANKIRKNIKEKLRLTCSCGVACNKMLAKICSDINKPDGQTYLTPTPSSVADFMNEMPVRKIPGIGKINEQLLSGLGITKCPDIINKIIDINVNFTVNATDFLMRAAVGCSKNTHDDGNVVKKSINVSETSSIVTKEEFEFMIIKLCKELEQRCKE